MKIMVTSFKMFHVHTATLSAPDSAAGHCSLIPLQETLKYSKAGLAQSLWDSGFLVMDRVSLRLSLWES